MSLFIILTTCSLKLTTDRGEYYVVNHKFILISGDFFRAYGEFLIVCGEFLVLSSFKEGTDS